MLSLTSYEVARPRVLLRTRNCTEVHVGQTLEIAIELSWMVVLQVFTFRNCRPTLVFCLEENGFEATLVLIISKGRMSHTSEKPSTRLTIAEYQTLAAFRYHLRRFLQFSEQAAQTAGLTPRQYQALLAIKGFPNRDRVTIAELAEQLQIVHHAAVELVDRLSAGNLVKRVDSLDDRRKVFVELTTSGSRVLDKLAEVHRDELRHLTPSLLPLLESLLPDRKIT